MNIILNNNLIIDIFVFVLLPISIFKKSSFCKYNNDFLSKNNTDVIRGISAIVVVLSHVAMFTKTKGLVRIIFINSGFLAVSVFLFTSGYGLMIQYLRNENYLSTLYRKIIYLYTTFFISNLIVTTINNLFLNTNFSIKDILSSTLFLCFSNGRELWFVAIILFMYLNFYTSFKIFRKNKALICMVILTIFYIILCNIFKKGTWWYNTAICFNIGVTFAIYKEKILNFYNNKFWIKLNCISAVFLIAMLMYTISKGRLILQFIIPEIFILLITMVLVKINLQSDIMIFISKISFEMYLVHLIILKVAFSDFNERNSVYLVLLFPMMVLLSLLVKFISNMILKFINKFNFNRVVL